MLREHLHLIGGEEGGVETDSKLANEIEITSLDGLNELCGTRLSHCSEVLLQVLLCHTHSVIFE